MSFSVFISLFVLLQVSYFTVFFFAMGTRKKQTKF